jgi:hypothetical protein
MHSAQTAVVKRGEDFHLRNRSPRRRSEEKTRNTRSSLTSKNTAVRVAWISSTASQRLLPSTLMNTFNPYVAGTSCILKGGDRADHRMTELNELIASAKASGGGPSQTPSHGIRFPRRALSSPAVSRDCKLRQALR